MCQHLILSNRRFFMSTPAQLYDTILPQLERTLGDLPATQLSNLAWLVATAATTQAGQLGPLARALPVPTLASSRTQRLRRFLANARVTQATHYQPLIRRLLTGLTGQTVRVLIDRVDLTPNFQVLMVSAAFRRRSVPLAWTVLDQAGSTAATTQIALLEQARAALPPGVHVILHGDGEFRSTDLFTWAREQDWRVVLGLSETTLVFRTPTGVAAGESIRDSYGSRRTRPLYRRGVYITEQRYGPVNVLIWWTKDQDGERIRAVGTDLRGDGYTMRAGRTRMWIETLFGDWQSRGFAVDKTGLQHADRLERLLLGLALAYVLLLSIGRWVVKRGYRRYVDRGPQQQWKLSLFQVAVSWLDYRSGAPHLPTEVFYLYG
jgi:hypothetical protein